MKKKVLFISCAAIVLVAIAGMLIFVLSGNNEESYPDNKEPVDIVGTWDVAAVMQNEVPTFVDNEFMIFNADEASSFKNGEDKPFASSSYSISADNTLNLPDIGRKYTIDNKNKDYIRLYESAEKYMILIRYPNSDMSEVEVEPETIVGKWRVEYRSGDPVDEVLEFSTDTLNDYRNGSKDPVSTSPYSWKDNSSIFADKWNKEFEYHRLSNTRIAFIEEDTGFVWVLEKTE